VRKEYFSTLNFKNQNRKGKRVMSESYELHELKKYHGADPRGEYICPHCGGVLYCVDETKVGDPIYQCQKCFKESVVSL